MDSCKIIYYLAVLIFSICYITNSTWLIAEDFSWAHYIFLLSCLLLLEKYDLVPSNLRCPPFYMVYKVVGAIVLATAALFTIWYQVEDLLLWMLNGIGAALDYIPGVGKKEAQKSDLLVRSLEILIAVYLLLYIIVSYGFITQANSGQGRGCRESTMNLRSSSRGKRGRSKGRC